MVVKISDGKSGLVQCQWHDDVRIFMCTYLATAAWHATVIRYTSSMNVENFIFKKIEGKKSNGSPVYCTISIPRIHKHRHARWYRQKIWNGNSLLLHRSSISYVSPFSTFTSILLRNMCVCALVFVCNRYRRTHHNDSPKSIPRTHKTSVCLYVYLVIYNYVAISRYQRVYCFAVYRNKCTCVSWCVIWM